MAPQMTKTAWRVGFKNALICGVGVFAFVGTLALAISAIFGRSPRGSATVALGIFLVSSFAAVGFGWLSGTKRSGSVLLDCGHIPNRGLFLFNAVSFLVLSFAGALAFFLNKFGNLGVAVAVLGLMGSAFYYFMASGRLQIRENGIWMSGGLLSWQKIQSHHWRDERGSATLIIQAKGKYPALGKSAFVVPLEHKDAIDRFITKYCAVERQ